MRINILALQYNIEQMRIILTLLLTLAVAEIFAQEITYEDFKTIIPFLQQEDYKGAYLKSSELLSKTKPDTSDIRAQVSYMNIFAAAGMVTLDQMTHDEFEKNLQGFVGKKIKMSGHPCVDSTKMAWNSFQFKRKDGELQGLTMTPNSKKVNILLFEYYKFKTPPKPEDFIGKNVRAGGILESFEVNPNKSKLWIGRIHISNAYVRGFIPK